MKPAAPKSATPAGYQQLLGHISDTYTQGRAMAVQAVNAHLTQTYWQVGRHIVEFEQGGHTRAEYGKALINRFGSFANVLAAPQQTLMDTRGLGVHSVSALKLVQASALRLARAEVMERPVLNNWTVLIDYLTAVMAREKIEQFRVLFLDTRNRLLADEAQARGTVNHTPVYPREVVKRALDLQATALILVHNHPSGDPTPSRADIEMTQEVKAAAQVLGIVLHDHVIIGNGRHLSFRREGLL